VKSDFRLFAFAVGACLFFMTLVLFSIQDTLTKIETDCTRIQKALEVASEVKAL